MLRLFTNWSTCLLAIAATLLAACSKSPPNETVPSDGVTPQIEARSSNAIRDAGRDGFESVRLDRGERFPIRSIPPKTIKVRVTEGGCTVGERTFASCADAIEAINTRKAGEFKTGILVYLESKRGCAGEDRLLAALSKTAFAEDVDLYVRPAVNGGTLTISDDGVKIPDTEVWRLVKSTRVEHQ